MKIIQQDFKVSTKLGFSLGIVGTTLFIYCFMVADYNDLPNIIFKIFGMLLLIPIGIITTYLFSHSYEFKQKEIVIYPLFGLLGSKHYSFNNLKKVEYLINSQGVIEDINFYFENLGIKKKITITMFQVNLGKVRLFLHANIDNLDDISVEKNKKFA